MSNPIVAIVSKDIEKHASGGDIGPAGDFHEVLRELLVSSHQNGIDVTGGWQIVPESDTTLAWDVEITQLARETTHESPTTDEFPVDSILTAVASHEGVEKTELPPLQDSIDVESLEHMFDDLADGPPGEVTFYYCGYRVTVYGDGQITVEG
ncbi:HalOD1 output domain-containing protein [Halapricum hydrolyticum]|uniref:Halobacterial output domain-containing protein n=1 Tax=Halapricum hydrolyticum TaxID=2979991 RepID=A0ABT2Q7S6_9EURY|nr:HalOD1 output domain-containing protein [Halapricum hydrolyticum]MCU4719595.1 hypothetical protein [Halapricum hydrolyticum]